jgi:hypothetical protein
VVGVAIRWGGALRWRVVTGLEKPDYGLEYLMLNFFIKMCTVNEKTSKNGHSGLKKGYLPSAQKQTQETRIRSFFCEESYIQLILSITSINKYLV